MIGGGRLTTALATGALLLAAVALPVACGGGTSGGGTPHPDAAMHTTCDDGGACSGLGQPCHAGNLYPSSEVHPCAGGLVCSWQLGDNPDFGGVCCEAAQPQVCGTADAGA